MARVPTAAPLQRIDPRPIAPAYQQNSGLLADAVQSQGSAENIERAAVKIEGVGDVLAQEAVKAQNEDNERAAKEADVKLSERMRAIMFGDGSEQNPGYYGLKGQAALDAYGPTQEAIKKAREEVGRGLNPRAKLLFDSSADNRFNTEFNSMSRYNLQERRVANDTASEVRIREANDSGVAAWNDPKRVAEAVAIIRGEVVGMGQRNGWSPEIVNSKIQEEQSKLYAGMINAALVRDPAAAQKLYDSYKTSIDGTARAAIERDLEKGTSLQQTQQETDRIMAMKLSPEAAIREAEKIKDPKVRDGVVKAVEHKIVWQQAREAHALAQSEKQAMQSASRAINSGQTFDQWQRENPQLAWIVNGKVGAVDNLYKLERLHAEGELFARSTDGSTLARLRTMPANELAQVDLEVERANLTRSEYEKAVGYVAGAKRAIKDATDSVTKPGSTITNEAQQRVLSYAPRDSKGKLLLPQQDKIAAENEMNTWLAEQAASGKVPTQQDIDKKAAQIMMQVTVGSERFDGVSSAKSIAGRVKSMTPEEKATLRVPYKTMDPGMRDDIVAKFKAYGKANPSESEIEQFGGALLARDEARANKLLGIK